MPLYVISPWSKGGWVSSEVFDHTSIIRLIERRFGVHEPNISAFRRAMCGDLTSTLDFSGADDAVVHVRLPDTTLLADRARALPDTTTPTPPSALALPVQAHGVRPSRALPYELHASALEDPERAEVSLHFVNTGSAGAVFHVYDRRHLEGTPRRYAVEAQKELSDVFSADADGGYDLWVLGPNGFHRHFLGAPGARTDLALSRPEVKVGYDARIGGVHMRLINAGHAPCTFQIAPNAYRQTTERVRVAARDESFRAWRLDASGHWYDFTVLVDEWPGFARRFAGRVETGRHGVSDPAMGGVAIADQSRVR